MMSVDKATNTDEPSIQQVFHKVCKNLFLKQFYLLTDWG